MSDVSPRAAAKRLLPISPLWRCWTGGSCQSNHPLTLSPPGGLLTAPLQTAQAFTEMPNRCVYTSCSCWGATGCVGGGKLFCFGLSLPGCPRGCPGSAGIAGLPRCRPAVNTICLKDEGEFALKIRTHVSEKRKSEDAATKSTEHEIILTCIRFIIADESLGQEAHDHC